LLIELSHGNISPVAADPPCPIKRLNEIRFTNTSFDRKRFLTFLCQKAVSAEKPALVHRYRGQTAKYSPFMMGMVKHRKITINAVSFMDLQLKLAKHPNWRILEISRLNFGFKIIFQRTAKEKQQGLPEAVPLRAPTSMNFITRRKSPT
jgi:hypothetical protein